MSPNSREGLIDNGFMDYSARSGARYGVIHIANARAQAAYSAIPFSIGLRYGALS